MKRPKPQSIRNGRVWESSKRRPASSNRFVIIFVSAITQMNQPINRVKSALPVPQVAFAAIFLALTLGSFSGCGSGNKSSTSAPTSKIANRVFVSNLSASVLNIVDAKADTLSTFTVGGVSGPTQMFESADKNTTIVYNSLPNTFAVVSNATEAVTASVSLGSAASSLAVTADASRAFAALPSGVCANSSVIGAVAVVSLTNATVTNCIPVTGARSIAL